jgi:small-conductance mechanosensitive channel
LFSRALRRWLENSYLPHTALDSGARTSLSTGVGYLGFLAASLASVAYLGVSLEKVALIASALSVGIGFGLQAIISNFVSGLILLVERPIKVGDQVSVSGSTGDVKRISVRATEIAMNDGSIVVVPNSDLISKPVVNKTRVGTRGLVQIMLRVVYGTDPDQVRKLVLEIIAADERMLKDPVPKVYIDDVDDRGYVFNVQSNVANPRDVYAVRSDLFFSVTRRLREAGIALANPLASSFFGLPRESDSGE